MSHFTCTHRNRVDSQLLVVRSQTTNLTPGPSFDHNLCFRCPNGSCEAILDIYTSRPFQRYQERLNARCFDPCNHAPNFWESYFQECEWRPHNSLKVGLRHGGSFNLVTCELLQKSIKFFFNGSMAHWYHGMNL